MVPYFNSLSIDVDQTMKTDWVRSVAHNCIATEYKFRERGKCQFCFKRGNGLAWTFLSGGTNTIGKGPHRDAQAHGDDADDSSSPLLLMTTPQEFFPLTNHSLQIDNVAVVTARWHRRRRRWKAALRLAGYKRAEHQKENRLEKNDTVWPLTCAYITFPARLHKVRVEMLYGQGWM